MAHGTSKQSWSPSSPLNGAPKTAEHSSCCFSADSTPKLCWMINTSCNLRCPHCGVFDNGFVAGHRSVSSQADIDRVVSFVAEHEVGKVVVSGGEPTLSPWLGEIISQLDRIGVESSLSTNATTLSARRVSELCSAGLRKATVSVDGSSPASHDRLRGPGAFAKMETGVMRLRERGVVVTVGAFLHPAIERDLGQLGEWCSQRGIRRLCLFRPIPRGRYLEGLDELASGLSNRELLAQLSSARRDGLVVSLHTPTCDDACPSGHSIFGAIGGTAFDHCVYKPRMNRRLAFELAA